MMLRAILSVTVVTVATAAPVMAAEPESGEVSPSQPTATWTGTIEDPFGSYDTAFWFAGTMGPSCQQPHCDTFGLTVGTGGTALTIAVTGRGADNVAFEVEDPNGEVDYVDDADSELRPRREQTFSSPAPGDWVVRVSGSPTDGVSLEYTGSATLSVPEATGAPSGGGTEQPPPPPSGSPPPSPPPESPPPAGDAGPTPAPMPTLTVRAPAARARSARRLRRGRRLSVRVTTSAPLRNVTAVLVPRRRQTRVVASGRRATLSGAGTVRLRLRRAIARGRYVLLVAGVDEQNRRVTARRAITIRR